MKWEKREFPPELEAFKANGFGRLTAITLCNAGIKTVAEANDFLYSDSFFDTQRIKNIDAVSNIIWSHINDNNTICVFGDYDADGVTASAITYLALKKLGANVVVRLPDRINEGYGISIKAIDEQLNKNVKLFITVDNGIRAIKEIEYARKHGAEVVVLDHHQPGENLPAANAIIDLHIRGESYPYIHLTGSGLAWKVCFHLLESKGYSEFALSLIDLAAIGTVADVESLNGENRVIVKRAIQLMKDKRYKRYGVKYLLNGDLSNITAEDIAFRIGPCINAAGRLKERGAELPLALLLEQDQIKAMKMSMNIIDINTQRKTVQASCYEKIKEEAQKQIEAGDKVLVLYADGAPSGIVGLLAGNLKEEFNRPAIVFSAKNDLTGNVVWTGSARSISSFNMLDALEHCQREKSCFLGFGGHFMAAGMSIEAKTEMLLSLREAINQYADKVLSDEELVPFSVYDMEIAEEDINDALFTELNTLEPFGEGCPKPVFKIKFKAVSKGSKCFDTVGENSNHVKIFSKNCSVVGFNMLQRYIDDDTPRELTCLGNTSENHYEGNVYHQFIMLDYKYHKIEKPSLAAALSAALNTTI